MEKNDFNLFYVRFCHSGYEDIIIHFASTSPLESVMDAITNSNFNEFEWREDPDGFFEKSHIQCSGYELGRNRIDTLPSIFSMQTAAETYNKLGVVCDYYIEASYVEEKQGTRKESSQYVYLFNNIEKYFRCVGHTAWSDVEIGMFGEESSVMKYDCSKEKPAFHTDAEVYCMDDTEAVPHYDRFYILSCIKDIDRCADISALCAE